MSTLTLGEARSMIDTDLNDVALQLMIDDAEAEIAERAGSLASQVDEFKEELTNILVLSRKAASISSVVEKDGTGGSYTSTALAATDYWLRQNTRILERLSSGTNPRQFWGDVVIVTYVPQDDTTRRKIVTVDLIKLALAFNGLRSESVGDYSASALEYEEQRQKIIDRLRGGMI
jgi:hypothetical protein